MGTLVYRATGKDKAKIQVSLIDTFRPHRSISSKAVSVKSKSTAIITYTFYAFNTKQFSHFPTTLGISDKMKDHD